MKREDIEMSLWYYECGTPKPDYANSIPDAWANAAADVHHEAMKPTASPDAMNDEEEAVLDAVLEQAAQDVWDALLDAGWLVCDDCGELFDGKEPHLKIVRPDRDQVDEYCPYCTEHGQWEVGKGDELVYDRDRFEEVVQSDLGGGKKNVTLSGK